MYNNKLAIVIPAYKALFLNKTLESISQQTDKRFKVYIGDDCSPENISNIVKNFSDKIDLCYKRFNNNLGYKSLVHHWNRCIEMCFEQWIWIFCDDDIMEPECVESFHKSADYFVEKYQVYRFNTSIIDAKGEVTKINPPHPLIEKSNAFAYHRLARHRFSYVSEYIFSRKVFVKTGGMIDFPLAWCSDDASWITFSQNNGIYTISGPMVRWRSSNLNITKSGSKYQKEKFISSLKYLDWLILKLNNDSINDLEINKKFFYRCASDWFTHQLKLIAPFGVINYFRLSKIYGCVWKFTRIKKIIFLLWIDIMFYCNTIIYRIMKSFNNI